MRNKTWTQEVKDHLKGKFPLRLQELVDRIQSWERRWSHTENWELFFSHSLKIPLRCRWSISETRKKTAFDFHKGRFRGTLPVQPRAPASAPEVSVPSWVGACPSPAEVR